MFDTDAERIGAVERTRMPTLPLLAVLAGAMVTGYLLTWNIFMAFGFFIAMGLFCVMMLRPASLTVGLVVLSVFIERSLQFTGVPAGESPLLNFGGIVNLCLCAAIVFYIATDKVRPFQSLITSSFAPYLAVVALSAAVSVHPMMTVRSVVRIASGYCIYLMITRFIVERRQIDRLVQILILISILPILVGLHQIVFENRFALLRLMRVNGTFRSGMSYAMYLAVILPYLFGQAVFGGTRGTKRGFFAVLFVLGVVNLIYTNTRIGWGAFALAMVAYGLLTDARRLLPVILIVLVASVLVFFPFFVENFGGYFATDWETYFSDTIRWDFRSAEYITASSLHIRVYVWRHMLRQLLDTNPWLGAGSGTWFEHTDVRTIGFPIASHSDYFEVLYGAGFIGLSFYLLFRMRQLTLLARFATSGIERRLKTTVLFPCLATHIAFLGMSITEVWQAYSGVYWLSWITLGISESYYRGCCEQTPRHRAVITVPPDVTYN
jgi:O-antigen ligase